MIYTMLGTGHWVDRRQSNLLDGGAPFYDTYACKDGRFVAVGALEPQFYATLLRVLEFDAKDFPQYERARWPELKQRFAAKFATRTRAQWAELLEHEDACATAVLGLGEAPHHPHNQARKTFVTVDGRTQPAPAPRFSRTPAAIGRPAAEPGAHTDEALADWGVPRHEIERLHAAGAITRRRE
jgi:alpha-methylacyl-CoA racemase